MRKQSIKACAIALALLIPGSTLTVDGIISNADTVAVTASDEVSISNGVTDDNEMTVSDEVSFEEMNERDLLAGEIVDAEYDAYLNRIVSGDYVEGHYEIVTDGLEDDNCVSEADTSEKSASEGLNNGMSDNLGNGTSEGFTDGVSDRTYTGTGKEYNKVWISKNEDDNDYYYNWDTVSYSNMTVLSDGTLMRVEYDDSKQLHIEYYDTSYKMLSNRIVKGELTKFGGFYNDGKNYYVVYGQQNSGESDSVEVIRVVKYDTSWNRLSAYSLFGANTEDPFRAGSLRIDSDADYLYILTCHRMYKSSDGLNHQSNMYMKIKKDTMVAAKVRYKVERPLYVSHSFNQFIKLKGDYIYTLDHGDAYPRSAVLTCANKNTSQEIAKINLINYYGEIGANVTNAKVGGMELGGSSIITVGTSTRQDGTDKIQKAYMTVTPISNVSSTATKTTWFTDDSNSDGLTAPQLVKINDNRFMVLFTKGDGSSSAMEAILVDGSGNKISSKSYTGTTSSGLYHRLSDCQPIYNSATGCVTWYVTNNLNMRICTVNASSLAYSEKVIASLKPIKDIRFEETKISINEGDTYNLKLVVDPVDTTDTYRVEWTNAENAKIAKADGKGGVIGLSAGSGSVRYTIYVNDSFKISSYVGVTVSHVWDNGTITKQPSENYNGVIEYKCIKCGETKSTYIGSVEYINTQKAKVKPFVERLYSLVLNREGDASGIDDWCNRLARKQITGAEAAYGFFMSSEMVNRGLSNEEYVKVCYRTMLNREADESGLNDWGRQLNKGASRLKILAGFTDSVEFGIICNDYGIDRGELSSRLTAADEPTGKDMQGIRDFVARCYTKALGREAENAGLEDWSNKIAHGTWTAEKVASDGFFHSKEFANKNTSNDEYVEILYRTFLGREYDEAGKADWVGKLNSGVNRDDVLYGFSRSREFANIMAQYGL